MRAATRVPELSSSLHFTLAGRRWRIHQPPLDALQELVEICEKVSAGGGTDAKPSLDRARSHYALVRELEALLKKLVEPVGPFWRALAAFGIGRHPFRRATEADLYRLAGLILGWPWARHGARVRSGSVMDPFTR